MTVIDWVIVAFTLLIRAVVIDRHPTGDGEGESPG